jgi:putative CocE/NonD family hydrolase
MTDKLDNETNSPREFGTIETPPKIYSGLDRRANYLPMCDGVKIAVDVTLPKNLPEGEKLPTLLSQTRYWREMELNLPFKWFISPDAVDPITQDFKPFFTSRGYALVSVDVRGTGASFGKWSYPWEEKAIEDTREIIDWIVAQTWSNGKVGAYGISYLGTTAELVTVLHHPAVKAVIPMFNHPDPFTDIALPGGIFNDRFIKDWSELDHDLDRNVIPKIFGLLGRFIVTGVKPVDEDKDRQMLNEAITEHHSNTNVYELAQKITYRDEVQPDINICHDDFALLRYKEEVISSGIPICGWGSWMDAGTADAVIRRFLTIENNRRAVIGAWEHGGHFHASPYVKPTKPSNPDIHHQWAEMMNFFDAYLKDIDNDVREEKILFYYTMGEEKWKSTNVWPPLGIRNVRFYLTEESALTDEIPEVSIGSDTYKVDYEASTGDNNRWWELGTVRNKTVFYKGREKAGEHILTYTSSPLSEDIEITGHPVVNLYITSTETDGAFYVYIEDVDEQGKVTYITEGQLRGIHRKVSNEKPPNNIQVPYHTFRKEDAMPLIPGEVAELSFGLNPTSVLIQKGHRIRLGIAGHDTGTFTRIPKVGNPVIEVMRNRSYASNIYLPVVYGE